MEQLLQNIRYNNGKFPRNELLEMIERKEEAIPYLLQIMNELKDDYQKVIDNPSRMDFIYAYYLLAQFRVKELFPIMVDLLSMPSDISDHIFDDAITEDMGRILASVFNGEIELLFSLIENTEANEYARGQALIALVVLVFNGQLSREFVMDYFKQLLTDKLTDTSHYFNAEIVCCCNDLYPEEVYSDIERLYEKGFVEFIIDFESIDETLGRSKDEVLQSNKQDYKYQFLTDAVKELQGWGCFHQDEYTPSADTFSKIKQRAANDEPNRNPAIKVDKIGRNDPCPCGSGKKYKKCCG